jgi:hypothetical protein
MKRAAWKRCIVAEIILGSEKLTQEMGSIKIVAKII